MAVYVRCQPNKADLICIAGARPYSRRQRFAVAVPQSTLSPFGNTERLKLPPLSLLTITPSFLSHSTGTLYLPASQMMMEEGWEWGKLDTVRTGWHSPVVAKADTSWRQHCPSCPTSQEHCACLQDMKCNGGAHTPSSQSHRIVHCAYSLINPFGRGGDLMPQMWSRLLLLSPPGFTPPPCRIAAIIAPKDSIYPILS